MIGWPRWWTARTARAIPDSLWSGTLNRLPFLAALTPMEQTRLRALCGQFLSEKQFEGAHGLVVDDAMALLITAQAVRPLLHLTPPDVPPRKVLAWYDDFVGIVVHPGEAMATRESMDEDGVVHRWREVIAGEAMDGGPVMVNWTDARRASDTAADGYNVVIHEFVHKIDLRDGQADGCPPLPPGYMGTSSARQARTVWHDGLNGAWQDFRDALERSRRFGAPAPWLDPYGAEALEEFFCVTCEAYFVNRPVFEREFPGLVGLFDAFWRVGWSV